MVKMKNEVFKSVVQVKVELNSNLLSANVPQELVIISPHPLSDTTLLLFSHDKLLSALKQDESPSTLYKFLSEDNDSINHVRLEMDMGVLKLNILKKNELLYDLTPNINVLDLIEEVRLFAPSTQPRAGILAYGIEFSFRNVLCAEAHDNVDDSRVYGIVTYHPESETLDIHCNDFIDNDDAYVIIDNEEVCVQKKSHNMVEWPISFENGKYILKHKQQPLNKNFKLKRLDTNFKVSSTLIFRFGNENSSVLNWTKIYTNRNKAAHYDPNNEITKSDIEEILDFIGYFSDKGKIDKKNIDKSLKVKTLEESKELLFNTPGNFKISKHKK